MNYAAVIFGQILTMYIYMGCGFFLFRKKLVTQAGSASFAHTLLYIVLPCAILQSFFTPRTAEKTRALIWSLGCSVIILLLAMVVAAVLFRHRPIDNFGAAFSNAGFMGLPLITAMLGEDCVFYVAGMIAILNILQWFYGQSVLSGQPCKISFGVIAKNPLVLALVLGLICFFGQFTLPTVVTRSISAIGAMNGPMAMIILGFYLAQTTPKSLFCNVHTYWVSLVRLFIVPLLTIGVLLVVPILSQDMKLALLLAACAPIGANVAVYAQKLEKDYVYAVETVCLSTIGSIVSIPIVILLAQALFH